MKMKLPSCNERNGLFHRRALHFSVEAERNKWSQRWQHHLKTQVVNILDLMGQGISFSTLNCIFVVGDSHDSTSANQGCHAP